MHGRHWTYHLVRLLAGLLLALLAGWWTGHVAWMAGGFLLMFLGWQFHNSIRLYNWLQQWDQEPPESLGLWSEIFDHIATLQRKNRKRNRQYQAVIDDFVSMTDAFPDATLVVDKHDVLRWYNDSAVRLLGLKVPDDRGQTVTNLVREPAFADWLAIQGRLQSTLEMPCPTDSNIILQANAIRFRESQRLIILRDITDVANLERLRRDLVANVSHELRTPLTVLLGYLEMLQGQPGAADPEVIERMFNQARQMHALIEDLMELSRLEDQHNREDASEVDVPAMLTQLKEQAEDLSSGRHQLQFDIQSGLNMRGITADLRSAFQNLITNAIRYTPAGGNILVSWKAKGNDLAFIVKDSGIGIPHRDIPRITERFYRVGSDRNRQTGGTGLGLAIVKHVLNRHGGHLDISSEPGEGSEFRCLFPTSVCAPPPTSPVTQNVR